MVDELLNVDVGGIAQNAVGVAYDTILVFGIILLLAAVAGAVVYFSLFNKKVRVRLQTKDGSYVIDDKARKKMVDGVKFWRLQKMRMDVTPPPKQAINLSNKGKMVAECYVKEDDPEPVWIVDKGPSHEWESFKTEERALWVDRIEKANSRRKGSWAQTLTQLAVPITLIFLAICGIVFFEDIWGPMKESQEAMSSTSEQFQEASESLKAASDQNARMIQVLAGKLPPEELRVAQTVKEEP